MVVMVVVYSGSFVSVTDEIKWQIIPEYLVAGGNNNVKKQESENIILGQSSLHCIVVNSIGDRLTRSPLNTIFSQTV